MGTVLMDNKFDKLQNLMPILTINTTATKEHIPGRVQDKVDKGTGKGHPKYPSVQENAQAHADRAGLSCGAVAECLPVKIRSV